MSGLLKWQQPWSTATGVLQLNWAESWADSWLLEQTNDVVATGHQTITGDLVMRITKDIGTGTMATVGHTVLTTAGLGYPTEFVPSIGGMIVMPGEATIAGDFDFEEPLYLDPPLQLPSFGRATLSGALVSHSVKSIGSGVLGAYARTGFASTSFGYQTAIIKQLFSVQLATAGRTSLTGNVGGTTVKEMGSGFMGMGGRSTILQDSFQIEAPVPFTHPIGTGVIDIVGSATTEGNPVWTDFPPHDMGTGTMAVSGRATTSTLVLFAGGTLPLGNMTMSVYGRTQLNSIFSYPGVEYPDSEAIAIYEGMEMQEAIADQENVTMVAT